MSPQYEDYRFVNSELVLKEMCKCDDPKIEKHVRRTCKNCGGLW